MTTAEVIFNYCKKSYNIKVVGLELLDATVTKGRIHVHFYWRNDKGEEYWTTYILTQEQWAGVKHIVEEYQQKLENGTQRGN